MPTYVLDATLRGVVNNEDDANSYSTLIFDNLVIGSVSTSNVTATTIGIYDASGKYKDSFNREAFFRFDCSSIASGETINSAVFSITSYIATDLTAFKFDAGSTLGTEDFISTTIANSLTKYSRFVGSTGSPTTLTTTTYSALATDVAARGTINIALVGTGILDRTYAGGSSYVIMPANATTAYRPKLTVVTTASGTTQTATATGVTNSPAVASGATRTAVATATAVSNSPSVAAAAAAIQSANVSTTTSPTPAASATVVRAVDAAVTTSPTSTASGAATQSASASVTTSPTPTATATQSTAAKSADAALTTSPTTAATGVRVVTATATNVTVSPTTSAAAVRVAVADSSTTVTPSVSGQSAATHNAVAAYALTPLTAAVATVTRTVSASGVTVTIITAAVADIGARRGQMSAATKATATMSAATRTSATMTGA